MKKLLYLTTLLIVINLLLVNCSPPSGTVRRNIINAKTPDLKSGSEVKKRTGRHPYMVPNIVFSKGQNGRKLASLTFDDGPDVYYTTKILDILDETKTKATFFIVGMRAQKHPEIVKRIINAGHSIGNHTWDHADLNNIPPDNLISEVTKTEKILTEIGGDQSKLFRPPYGIADQRVVYQLASMGYKVIDWSVDTRDWAGTPSRKILRYVKKEITPGGIILEHCAGGKGENLENTVTALPQIISYLKDEGYILVTVPELLGFT